MTAVKRNPTKYPGVYYREVKRTGSPQETEKVFYIVFKKEGKVHEEKVGRQHTDDMTPARAATIRAERIEGKRISRKEERETAKAAEEAERNKVTIGKIWAEYQVIRADKKSLATEQGLEPPRRHRQNAPLLSTVLINTALLNLATVCLHRKTRMSLHRMYSGA